jgi:hypothetical protein
MFSNKKIIPNLYRIAHKTAKVFGVAQLCPKPRHHPPLVCGVFLYLHLKGTPWQWRPNKPKLLASTPEATNPPRSQHSKLYKNHESTGTILIAGASATNACTAPRLMPCGKTRSTANYQTLPASGSGSTSGRRQIFLPSSDK